MPLSAEELEQPYFVPTSENVSQILAELRAAEADREPIPTTQPLPPEQPKLELTLEDVEK